MAVGLQSPKDGKGPVTVASRMSSISSIAFCICALDGRATRGKCPAEAACGGQQRKASGPKESEKTQESLAVFRVTRRKQTRKGKPWFIFCFGF